MPMRASRRAAPAPAPAPAAPAWRAALLAVAIVLAAVGAVHAPVLGARALCMDDDTYVTSNPLVNRPSAASVQRFFGEVLAPSTVGGYWMPLSMTSLMLDVAAGGTADRPAPFHRTSLALHALAALALLAMLRTLVRSWPAAVAGTLLFALHPLTVEPLAWIGERKTVLAGALALGATTLHVAWARAGGAARRAGAVALFALALLAKPTATPLPLMLLALDLWPLRRMGRAAVVEKWPFFALALGSGAITLASHAATAGMSPGAAAPAGTWATLPLVVAGRLAFYADKLAWPAHLSPVYPALGPFAWSRADAWVRLVAVVAVAALAVARARRNPAPLALFAWAALALAPVLGALRYSWIAVSDKYAYLALVAPALAAAAALAALAGRPAPRAAAWALVLALLAGEVALTRAAYAPWRDSLALWTHVAEAAPGEAGAQHGLGAALVHAQRWDEARAAFRLASALDSTFFRAACGAAMASLQLGDTPAAAREIALAERHAPQDRDVLFTRALVAQRAGDLAAAEAGLRRVLGGRPDDVDACWQLAGVLEQRGRLDESLALYEHANRLEPANVLCAYGVAHVRLRREGLVPDVRARFERIVRDHADFTAAANELAWALATDPDPARRDGPRALELARAASRAAGDRDLALLDTRAAAEANAGRFADAIATETQVLALAESARVDTLAALARARIAGFRAGQPVREPAAR